MDAFPGVPGGGHLRPLCGGSRCRDVPTAILGAVGFCDTRGASSCLGLCWLNMLCSHRYVTLLRLFFWCFFYKHHSETKKHWVACVLNGWSWLVMLFSICFFVLPKGMFLKRGGFSTEKKRLSSEVKVGVCCNQKICRIFWWKIHETRQVFSCNDIFGSWVGQS